jgi:hypothetical protein
VFSRYFFRDAFQIERQTKNLAFMSEILYRVLEYNTLGLSEADLNN